MFFIISQKINNLLLKTNDIFNYKIGIIGILFYIIIFIFIKFPLFKQINLNNWMLFFLFIGFLLIDGLLISNDFYSKIKNLEKENEKIYSETNTYLPNNQDYETTTDLDTTQEE